MTFFSRARRAAEPPVPDYVLHDTLNALPDDIQALLPLLWPESTPGADGLMALTGTKLARYGLVDPDRWFGSDDEPLIFFKLSWLGRAVARELHAARAGGELPPGVRELEPGRPRRD